jgi:hypothetical protein
VNIFSQLDKRTHTDNVILASEIFMSPKITDVDNKRKRTTIRDLVTEKI